MSVDIFCAEKTHGRSLHAFAIQRSQVRTYQALIETHLHALAIWNRLFSSTAHDQAFHVSTSIRLVVAAAEPLFLAGCRAAIGTVTDYEVLAECPTIAATIRALRRYRPDVLVVESALCDHDQARACARFSQASPATAVACLARTGLAPCDCTGVPHNVAVLPPRATREELLACIRVLAAAKPARGGRPPSPTPDDPSPAHSPAHAGSPLALLTFRERQIVLGVLSGKRNREIAATLGITPGTVKIHLHKTFTKLGVHSRLALFRKLVQEAQPRRADGG